MKKGFLSFVSIYVVILTISFSSCDDDNDTPVLKVSQTTFELAADELTGTFTLTSNVGWVISSDQNWCDVTPQYGTGNETITITLTGVNEDLKNDRTAILTVKSGQTDSQEIEITQAAAPSRPTSAKEMEIFFTEGTVMTCYGYWYYFSFEEGKIIDFSNINTEEDESWKNRTDWDIAFSTFYSKTNSGVSGKGQGGVQIIGEDVEDKVTLFKELVIAPEEGYIADETVEGMMVIMPPLPHTLYTGGGSYIINSCLDIAGRDSDLSDTIFVLKTASGKYAKMYIKKWTVDSILFEYAYQPDGTTNLTIEE